MRVHNDGPSIPICLVLGPVPLGLLELLGDVLEAVVHGVVALMF